MSDTVQVLTLYRPAATLQRRFPCCPRFSAEEPESQGARVTESQVSCSKPCSWPEPQPGFRSRQSGLPPELSAYACFLGENRGRQRVPFQAAAPGLSLVQQAPASSWGTPSWRYWDRRAVGRAPGHRSLYCQITSQVPCGDGQACDRAEGSQSLVMAAAPGRDGAAGGPRHRAGLLPPHPWLGMGIRG